MKQGTSLFVGCKMECTGAVSLSTLVGCNPFLLVTNRACSVAPPCRRPREASSRKSILKSVRTNSCSVGLHWHRVLQYASICAEEASIAAAGTNLSLSSRTKCRSDAIFKQQQPLFDLKWDLHCLLDVPSDRDNCNMVCHRSRPWRLSKRSQTTDQTRIDRTESRHQKHLHLTWPNIKPSHMQTLT